MGALALARRVVPGSIAGTLSRNKKRIALAIAAAADLAQIFLAPLFAEGALSPLEDLLDVAVAVALTLVVGFRWRAALAFGLELIPGVALFPSWTAVVATLPTHQEDAIVSTEIVRR